MKTFSAEALAAIASGDGKAVAPVTPAFTPVAVSAIFSAGILRRAMPGMYPPPPSDEVFSPWPCTSWIFSSSVICASSARARWSAVSLAAAGAGPIRTPISGVFSGPANADSDASVAIANAIPIFRMKSLLRLSRDID